MSAEESRPRFVVSFDGCSRFWSSSSEEAEKYRQEKSEQCQDPTDVRVIKVEDDSLVKCCVSHANPRPLLFLDGGRVECPECGTVYMG